MAGRGRPSLYSPEVAAQIVNAIAAGVPKVFAAQLAGISYDTLNDWQAGRKGIPKDQHASFVQSIRRAEAQGIASRVARIAKAGQEGDWRADSWYLEHVYPEYFARTVQDVTISNKDGTPFAIIFSQRSDGPQ